MSEPDGSPRPLALETLGAVMRASARSANLVHQDLEKGLIGLATIASIAPWFGIFATLLGIANSSVACSGEMSGCMAVFADRLSGSMWPTALGLLVGLNAFWCYQYLSGRLEALDREVKSASVDLVNQLVRSRDRLQWADHRVSVDAPRIFAAKSWAELARDERFWRRSIMISGTTLFAALCVSVARYFLQSYLPLLSAAWAGLIHVPVVLVVCCIPAHIFWARLLRRRDGGLVAVASLLCLFWCVAELAFGVHLL